MANKKGQLSQGSNLLYLISRAKDVSTEDIYNYFESENVEDTLNELYDGIKKIKGNVISDLNSLEKISNAINNDPNFYQNIQNITSNISGVSRYVITKKEDYINNTYKIADILQIKTDSVVVGTYICVNPDAYDFNDKFRQLYGIEYVENQINALKGSVNDNLNTLEKIAKALNNDPIFYTTIQEALDDKTSLDEVNELVNDASNTLRTELDAVSTNLNARIDELISSGAVGGGGKVEIWTFSDYGEFVGSGIKNGDYALFYDYSNVKFYNCVDSTATTFADKFSLETNNDLIRDNIININLYTGCLSEEDAMNLTVLDNDIIYIGEPTLDALCVCKDDTSTNYDDAFLQLKDNNETKRMINEAISDLVDTAPESLNTLKELADALNNDPDFANTIINELAKKNSVVMSATLPDVADRKDNVTYYKILT